MGARARGLTAAAQKIHLGLPDKRSQFSYWICIWFSGFISGGVFILWLLLLWMHISLARACACDPQDACIFTRPTCGLVQATVFAYLSRPEAQRVLVSCILLLSDQRDILLSRTERQLDICLSTYSVPTPPVQVFLQPVVPGQGVLGSWNHFFTFQVHWKSTCPGGKERSHHLGQVILLVQVGQSLLRQTLLGAQQVAMKTFLEDLILKLTGNSLVLTILAVSSAWSQNFVVHPALTMQLQLHHCRSNNLTNFGVILFSVWHRPQI